MPKFSDVPYHVINKYFLDLLAEIEVDKREKLFTDGQLLYEDVLFDKGNAREIYFKDMPEGLPRENVLNVINMNWNLHYHESISYAKNSYMIGPCTTMNAGKESSSFKEYWVKNHKGYEDIPLSLKDIQQENNFIFEKRIDKITDVYEIDVEITSNTHLFFYPYTQKRYIKKGNQVKVKNKQYTYRNIIDTNITDNTYNIDKENQVLYFNINDIETINVNLFPMEMNTDVYLYNRRGDYTLIVNDGNEFHTIHTNDFMFKYIHLQYKDNKWNINILEQSDIDNLVQELYVFKLIDDVNIGDEMITSSGIERVFFKHHHDEVIIKDTQFEPTNGIFFRKDSYFYFWLNKYYPEYKDQVAINKLFLYLGPIFNNLLYPDQKDNVDIIYYGLKDYVLDALPDINKTPRFSEFLKLYFDRIHQTVYKNTKEISALMDPYEIQSVHLPLLANTFDIDISKIRYGDFRLRQYINNYVYFLKRKGTYTALIIIWLLLATRNKLHIFDTLHNENIPLKDHYPHYTNEFVPFPYLTETLHVTSDFRKHIEGIDYYKEEEKPFVFTKEVNEHRWNINHTFNTRNLLFYCYDKRFRQIIPAKIEIVDNFNVVLYFNKSVSGWCFVLKPITILKNQLVQTTNNNYYYNYSFFYEYYCNDNDVVFVDSRNKDITIHLPEHPEHLFQCKIIDIYDSFMEYSVMLKGRGEKIKEYYDNMLLNINGFNKTFLYLKDYGWTYIDSDLLDKNHIKTINEDYIAVRRDILLVDTRDEQITITLPRHPYTYDQVKIIDIYDSFSINNAIVNTNEQNIEGNVCGNLLLNAVGIDKTFVYINPDIGWIILNSSVLIDTDIKHISDDYQSSFSDILLVDTREKEVVIDLPTDPLQYEQVKIIDFYNTFDVNNVKVRTGNKRLNVIYDNMVLNVSGFDKTFIYIDDHVGWRYIESSINVDDKNRCIDYTKMIRLYDDELIALHKDRKDVMVHMQDTSYDIYKPVNIQLDDGVIKITNNTSMKDHYISYTLSNYRYIKEKPEVEWKVYHYLGVKGVICQCYDNDMNVIYPKEIVLVSDNICTLTFEYPVSGYVNIKPITKFNEGPDDIKLSTHYVVEMNLNEEPMDIDELKILSKDTIDGLYESWENIRPAVRSSHYRILISPTINMQSNNKRHYNRVDRPNFKTSCKVENVFEYDTYTHKQNYYNDVWNIPHGLYTNNLLYSFYDEEHNQVIPRVVEVVDMNNINVYFYKKEKGYALLVETDLYEKIDERDATWTIRSPFKRNILVNFTDIFNNNRFYPKSVVVHKNEYVETKFNKDEIGFVNIVKSDYRHNQIIPQRVWKINHNLLKGVMCQCFSWYNELIEPKNVKLIDDVTCEITFDDPWCGYANVKSINSLIYEDELFDYLETSTFRVGIKGSDDYNKSLPVNVDSNDVEHEIFRGNVILHRVHGAVYIQVDVPINVPRNDFKVLSENHTYGAITFYRSDKTDLENLRDSREILSTLTSNGFSVYRTSGSYISNLEHRDDRTFFVINRKVSGNDNGELELLLRDLCEKYDIERFMIVYNTDEGELVNIENDRDRIGIDERFMVSYNSYYARMKNAQFDLKHVIEDKSIIEKYGIYYNYDFHMTELGIFTHTGKMLFYSHFGEIYKPRDVSMRFLYKVDYI